MLLGGEGATIPSLYGKPRTVVAVLLLIDVAVASGSPNYWLITFLLGIVAGGSLSARTSADPEFQAPASEAGGFRFGGEQPVRYLQLAAGGLLLGA